MQGFNSLPSTGFCGHYSETVLYWPSLMCVHKGQSGWVIDIYLSMAVCLLFFSCMHSTRSGVRLSRRSCCYICVSFSCLGDDHPQDSVQQLMSPSSGVSTKALRSSSASQRWNQFAWTLGENGTHHAEHLLPLAQAELVSAAHRSGLMCDNLSGMKLLFCVQDCKEMTFASGAPNDYNYIHL